AARSLTTPLKLRGKGITITPFSASVCRIERNGAALFLFQLFPSASGNGPARTDAKTGSVEINLAQKQKLDCVLQLTRTVAIDFNNTLTAILGHATHILSNTKADDPWRTSLSEIEKAAGRAAEVANKRAPFPSEQTVVCAKPTGKTNNPPPAPAELFQPQH